MFNNLVVCLNIHLLQAFDCLFLTYKILGFDYTYLNVFTCTNKFLATIHTYKIHGDAYAYRQGGKSILKGKK